MNRCRRCGTWDQSMRWSPFGDLTNAANKFQLKLQCLPATSARLFSRQQLNLRALKSILTNFILNSTTLTIPFLERATLVKQLAKPRVNLALRIMQGL